LAEQQGQIISVHHNRRWDGDFLTVQQIVRQGYLEELVEYEAHYDRFRNYFKPQAWRETPDAGSGLLFDLGAHLLDQAQLLFGWPQAITADIRTQRAGGQTDDTFELRLDYASLKVTLQAGMLVREAGPRFILHGTHGSFVKSGFDPQEAALKAGHSPQEPNWGVESPAQWGLLNSQLGELHFRGQIETLPGCYQAYYQNVYEAITQQAELIVTAKAARNTIRLIELAWQSQREKRTIELS
jgi:predicted dehydrogenase